MTTTDFWASINRIIKEGFSPEGLNKLEVYADKFITGQLVYKRFSPFEQHGCSDFWKRPKVEVLFMSLHPYSREQKLQQINSLHQQAVLKEDSNRQRRKVLS